MVHLNLLLLAIIVFSMRLALACQCTEDGISAGCTLAYLFKLFNMHCPFYKKKNPTKLSGIMKRFWSLHQGLCYFTRDYTTSTAGYFHFLKLMLTIVHRSHCICASLQHEDNVGHQPQKEKGKRKKKKKKTPSGHMTVISCGLTLSATRPCLPACLPACDNTAAVWSLSAHFHGKKKKKPTP